MTSESNVQVVPAQLNPSKPLIAYAPLVARVLLGLLFFITGSNGFLNFLPQPTTPLPPGAAAFVTALLNTGYMFPLIMGTQLIVGILLLSNRFVPLALVVLAPFIVNSVAFHLYLEPAGRPMVLIVLMLGLYLAWQYRIAFRPLFGLSEVRGTGCDN